MDLRPRSKAVAFSIQIYEADSQDFNKLVENMNKELRRKGEANAEYTPEDVFQYVFRTFVRQNSDFEKYLAESKKERAGGQSGPKKKAKSKSAADDASGTIETEEVASGITETGVNEAEVMESGAEESDRPGSVAQPKSKKDARSASRSSSREADSVE